MFALLIPGLVIFGFTIFQAVFMHQQIISDHEIINRCYAVLNQPSNPPVADALEECQQLQQITTDQEELLKMIYAVMSVGLALIVSGTVFGFTYSSKLKNLE
jgi:aminopeptidase C